MGRGRECVLRRPATFKNPATENRKHAGLGITFGSLISSADRGRLHCAVRQDVKTHFFCCFLWHYQMGTVQWFVDFSQ